MNLYTVEQLEVMVELFLEARFSNSIHRLAARVVLSGFIKFLREGTEKGKFN